MPFKLVSKYAWLFCGLIILFSACRPEAEPKSYTLQFEEMEVPADSSSMFPALTFNPEGELLLNWLYEPDTLSRLMMAKWNGDQEWSTPREIATGSEWFINWADFPSLSANAKGQLVTYSLPKSSDDTYAYDVGLYQSTDDGNTWTGPIVPHHDQVKAEHGFVSFLNFNNGKIGAIWLDGRNYGQAEHEGHGGHGAGGEPDMTLRYATIDAQGNIADDHELDPKVCSCCQTDAALLPDGAIVVYRDRSAEEVRDIGYVRLIDGEWTAPQQIADDFWEIAGCPVNGPGVSTRGKNVAVSWYTAAEGQAQVKLAFSTDQGATFGAPIRLDAGEPLGRVDVKFWDEETALISWVEQESPTTAAIRLKLMRTDGETILDERVADFDPSRSSGFPRMAAQDGTAYLAWTETGPKPNVKLVKIQ
ncbi:glycoside hydrolase family 32 protein [Flavilitoribacter nigricans]|nr:glycoside hydrolase family 32 protein [Flavilitoribacter nigricans]